MVVTALVTSSQVTRQKFDLIVLNRSSCVVNKLFLYFYVLLARKGGPSYRASRAAGEERLDRTELVPTARGLFTHHHPRRRHHRRRRRHPLRA